MEVDYSKICELIKKWKPTDFKFGVGRSMLIIEMDVAKGASITAIVCAVIDFEEKILFPYSPITGVYVEPNQYHREIADAFGVKLVDEGYVKEKLIERSTSIVWKDWRRSK